LPQLQFRIVFLSALILVLSTIFASYSAASDKLVALYSSHAVPYSTPWIAEELGLFKKYDLDFDFVYIPSSSTATAAILGGNVEVGLWEAWVWSMPLLAALPTWSSSEVSRTS
jgi:ABC-type nitrate/sulfonate/bicarbonate transport system substrate-binding protein